MRNIFCALFLIINASCFASVDLSAVEVLRHIFKTKYAMGDYKKDKFGWDLDNELGKLSVGLSRSGASGHVELQKFFNSCNDFHVGGLFYSSESATLPFEVRECEGRYYVVWLDDAKMNSAGLFGTRIAKGDELILWDDRPIGEVVDQFFSEEYGVDGDGHSVKEMALSYLTRRLGEIGIPSPKSQVVNLVFQKKDTQKSVKKKLTWEIEEELVPKFGGNKVRAKSVVKRENPFTFCKKMGCIPYLYTQSFVRAKQEDGTSYGLGSRRGFLPTLGKKVWESRSDNPFFAYIFELDGKKVGFVRIPHYDGTSEDIVHFRDIIQKFNTSTDMLIVDEMNNPGGSLFFMYAILSNLVTKPIPTMDFCETITQKEILMVASMATVLPLVKTDAEAKECLEDTTDGYVPTVKLSNQLMDYCNHLLNEWSEGNTITSAFPLLGVDHIDPHPHLRYKKPILVLINGLCFSCADFFPAYMKENNRAIVMGQATAGAGGTVLGPVSFPNRFGLDNFTITQSFAINRHGSYVENVGTEPDIHYHITPNDCTNDWVDFVKAIKKQAKSMML